LEPNSPCMLLKQGIFTFFFFLFQFIIMVGRFLSLFLNPSEIFRLLCPHGVPFMFPRLMTPFSPRTTFSPPQAMNRRPDPPPPDCIRLFCPRFCHYSPQINSTFQFRHFGSPMPTLRHSGRKTGVPNGGGWLLSPSFFCLTSFRQLSVFLASESSHLFLSRKNHFRTPCLLRFFFVILWIQAVLSLNA